VIPRWNARLWWLALLLLVAFTSACNRLGAAPGKDSAVGGEERKLPFRSDRGAEPNGPGDPQYLSAFPDAKDGLPFRSPSHLRILPSGTLLTVRLEQPLDSGQVRAGDAFAAVVADPVNIDGDILVARGTGVTGAIESTQRSSPERSAGYIRLILSSITIDGKRMRLQTSSLFAQGTPAGHSGDEASLSSIRLPQGRRLTFRLIVPASLDPQESIANRQVSILTQD
jgi:hypothetical protein